MSIAGRVAIVGLAVVDAILASGDPLTVLFFASSTAAPANLVIWLRPGRPNR